MSYTVTQNRLKIEEIAKTLPDKGQSQPRDTIFNRIPQDILEEATDIAKNYIGEAEWGTVVKTAFDRTIRYYERDRVQARELVRVQETDSEFYQWLVGSGYNAYWTAPGAEKRTVTFDMSSRHARVWKAGLAIEFTDEMREAMTLNLMNETMSKTIDAFDALETNTVLEGISNGVANGTDYTGIKYSSHIIDGTHAKFNNSGTLDHQKFLTAQFVLDEEGFEGSTVTMNSKHFYKLMELEPFKDADDNWAYLTSPKAISIVEGSTPNKPVLPGIKAKRLIHSPLFPEDEMVMFDEDEYLDFVIREPLNSEVAPHDGLRDINLVTYRSRYGIAAREPTAAVKITNLDGIDVTGIFV